MPQPLPPADQGEPVTSGYPISQLIEKIIRNTGYTSFGFLLANFHAATEAMLPDLEAWLEKGEGHESTVALIAGVDLDEADNLHRAVTETAAMKAAGVQPVAQERSQQQQPERWPSAEFLQLSRLHGTAFKRYPYIKSESKRPVARTLGGGLDGFSVKYIDDTWTLEDAIRRAVRHYETETMNGSSVFGRVLEYWFVRDETHATVISTSGQAIRETTGPFWP